MAKYKHLAKEWKWQKKSRLKKKQEKAIPQMELQTDEEETLHCLEQAF